MSKDLIEQCYENGWTDGLPVVPPTRARVGRMLGRTQTPSDQIVAVLQPSGAVATRELIAANAVMAGCKPEYLPIVEAAVAAVAEPDFNLDRVLTTASSQVPLIMVCGPVVADAELSGSWEALRPQSRANATIGRALMLVLRNLASHVHGGMPHSTLGSPYSVGGCLTENLIDSPWPSWHVESGFDPADSWLSVFPADPPLVLTDMGHDDPWVVVNTLSEAMSLAGTYTAFFRTDAWLVMSPQHAHVFASAGWTREDLVTALFESSAVPADHLRGRGLYGYLDELRPPEWLNESDPVAVVDSRSRLKLFVSGGQFGGYTAIFFGQGPTVTRQIVWTGS